MDNEHTSPEQGNGDEQVAGGGHQDPPPPPPPGDIPSGGSTPPPPPSAGPPPSGHQPGTHPSGVPSDSRNWAMGAHLSAFVGAWVALAFLGPLVVWLIRREHGDSFTEHHAKEALNFNLSMFVYLVGGGIIGAILAVVTLGIGLVVLVPVALALVVAWIVLTILAAVKASNGETYRYPLTIRFVS